MYTVYKHRIVMKRHSMLNMSKCMPKTLGFHIQVFLMKKDYCCRCNEIKLQYLEIILILQCKGHDTCTNLNVG